MLILALWTLVSPLNPTEEKQNLRRPHAYFIQKRREIMAQQRILHHQQHELMVNGHKGSHAPFDAESDRKSPEEEAKIRKGAQELREAIQKLPSEERDLSVPGPKDQKSPASRVGDAARDSI
jgi:hypothetical protein